MSENTRTRNGSTLKGGIDSIAGTVATLSPTEQHDVNAEAAGPGNGAVTNQPQPTQMDWQLMAQQLAESNKALLRERSEKEQLIAKQAEQLAASQFYTHQVGGKGGSDPITDQSVRLIDLPDGKQALDIRVYLNQTPRKGKVVKGQYPITQLDAATGKRVVVLENGKPKYPEYINWDLGSTTIRECPIVVKTKEGPVTVTGMAIVNVGRFTAEEVTQRADTVEANLNKAKLSDADVSEDGLHLVGSDTDETKS